MIGGAGDDVYVVDNTSDVVTEAASAGTDTIEASVTFNVSSNVESIIQTGSGNINSSGNTLDNIMVGNSGTNTLSGGDGNDAISGGDGNDVLNGGNGIDTLNGGNGNDTINGNDGDDAHNGGAGDDMLYLLHW
jgi:Ca2+-binding RTX toxin-like protein